MKHKIVFSLLLAGAALCSTAQQNTGMKLINTLHIASAGGWDYLTTCSANNNIYVSHGTHVNILDKTTGDSVGIIDNTTGVHGIAFNLAAAKGYTSNGKLNNVSVFDLKTNSVTTQIATGQNPDAIFYEPFSKKIITCNGRSNNLSIIDPELNKTIDSVPVGGKPETAVSDGAGKIFVNIEDKNEIAVIDTKTFKLVKRFSLAPAEGPTGLAYDKKTKRLFAGCDKLLVVINAETGKVVTKLPIGDGCDGVAFDSLTRNIYTSNGEGTMTVIHEDNADKYTVLENIITKKGARTIAIDEASHLLYLPSADFEAQAAGEKGRPKMIPGSFQILVIGK